MCWASLNRTVILEVTTLSCPPYQIFKIVLQSMHQPIRVQDSKMFLSQSSSMEHATGHSSLDSSIIFVAYFVRPVPLRSSVGNLKLRNSLGRGFSVSGSPSVASSLTSGFFHTIISNKSPTRSNRVIWGQTESNSIQTRVDREQ